MRLFVSLLAIIPLAGTLVRCVPPPRPKTLAIRSQSAAVTGLLTAQLKQFAKAFRAGDIHSAAALAERGYQDALAGRELRFQARFLGNLGGCRFALHQYKEALQAYTAARKIAEARGENTLAANLDLNISSIYLELRQMDAALDAARRAMGRLSGDDRTRRLSAWLIHLAHLRSGQERMPEAISLYLQGIAAADRAGDLEMYAVGWDDLGYDYLKHRQLPQAEHALLESYHIRKLYHLRSIEGSYRNLGMLRLQQGDLPQASRLLDRAVQSSLQPGGLEPAWEVYQARGSLRLAQHRLQSALDDLRIAARLSRIWRRGALPDDATRVSTENFVQAVHTSLVATGNQLFFETGRRALAQETFESAEANRAASLRALLAEPRDWRRNLPAEYWETLQKLESAEVELVRGQAPSGSDRIQQLQATLIQWESQAGSTSDVEIPDLLQHTRRILGPGAALFSFHLSSPHSYLWAVSRDRFELYRLPPAADIAAMVERFTGNLRQGKSAAEDAGYRLFQTLFGQIAPEFQNKPHWLVALDAQLFNLPLAAMVVETRAQGPVFLAERHSLQTVSGAGMLMPAGGDPGVSPGGSFLGVADPVYNTADPRWSGAQTSPVLGFFTARAADSNSGQLHLARLAGSAQEASACAAAWRGPRAPVLLVGPSATRQRLQAELRGHPAILHFATHVLQSGPATRSGLIALSLDPGGQYQVLGPAEIATWNLEGALVSLSGCNSGVGNTLPGTGLVGLTRACLAAGARAVVASRWPTPDDSGALFLSFYRNLHAAPLSGPAVALQRAQIAMLRSGTQRARPAYWGAFFVTGNRQ